VQSSNTKYCCIVICSDVLDDLGSYFAISDRKISQRKRITRIFSVILRQAEFG